MLHLALKFPSLHYLAPDAAFSSTLSPQRTTPSRRVLLALNQQVGWVADPPQGIPSAHASAEQAPRIIHFRNCREAGNPDEEGTPSCELLNPLLPGEVMFDKRKTNAFSGTTLGKLVSPDTEVVLVGLMSEHSVKATRWSNSGGNELQTSVQGFSKVSQGSI
ncbi:Isochorismatase hydrolase [Mycena venus]|uniref:Isochorismatase hydrolase n=1 Tax=Mycena venus TaxID=2733690 RepID=A0A8H6XF16_9AGAR|nr:Isochorismatase hydrolase [Mycena venus]